MGGHELVIVEELHDARGGAQPEPFADEGVRRRVVALGEDDVAVGVELRLLPLDQIEVRRRQR